MLASLPTRIVRINTYRIILNDADSVDDCSVPDDPEDVVECEGHEQVDVDAYPNALEDPK